MIRTLLDDNLYQYQFAPEPGKVLLLSHGKSIAGEQAIGREIDNRLEYLRPVWEGQGQIGFEEATAACTCRFLCSQWHIRAEAP